MDETDVTDELIKRIGKNQILVDGRTEVRRVNDFFKVDLGNDAKTVSGLIQEHLGRIPATGEASKSTAAAWSSKRPTRNRSSGCKS